MKYLVEYMNEYGDIERMRFDNETEAMRFWNAMADNKDVLLIGGVRKEA